MKTIKILHLYSQSLDLYGDYKNLTVLAQRIRESGNEIAIDTAELFEPIEPKGYDLVYIGHGKARNLAAAAEHFIQYSEPIKAAIEEGQLWLAIGNSRELFGKRFETPGGATAVGIGLFDYTGVETGKVFVSDMIGHPAYDPEATVYGFCNRTAYLEGKNPYPLFEVITGFGDGKEPGIKEGTLYKNFFATWSLGPVLARNPSLMKEILSRLVGADAEKCDLSLEQCALDLVINEFKKGN